MKKQMTVFLLLVVLCLSMHVTAFAESEEKARLVDMADILNKSDEDALLSVLNEISERQQFDIVIVTTNTLDGKKPMAYADDFYDDNGYGFGAQKDGVLLLVSMEDRDWWVSTTGRGITVFTDAGITYISEQFLPALSDGDYAEAFTYFARLCDAFITQAKAGQPYDIGNLPKSPFRFALNIGIALLAGLVFAVITTAVMKGRMKSVRSQPAAANYIKNNSLAITESRDLFLYAHVDRRAKPKNSSSSGGSRTHTSSSGTSHGGRGGKF